LIYKGDYFMKKARLILSAVAVLAVIGGTLAFKAGRFTPFGQAYTFTNSYTVGGVAYSGASTYVPVLIGGAPRFFTASGGAATTLYSTTSITTTALTTFTEVNGTATITFPRWGANLLATRTQVAF
jgi:hypothetical protein